MPPRLRVLILSDDPASCREMFTCLQDENCRLVGIAADQKQAAALSQKESPDVILANGLGNGDGDLSRLRSIKKDLGLPLVLAGAHWDGDIATRLKDAGVDSLVPAGGSAKTLSAALRLAKRNQTGIHDMALQTEMLNDALQTRKLVGRAAGLLMDHKDMKRVQALALLESMASEDGIPLEEAAVRIIASFDENPL